MNLTIQEVANLLRKRDNFLILTHRRPDGDTLGCAAALCRMLHGLGKTAFLLKNEEVTARYAPYVDGLWAATDYVPDTVVSVDLAALSLFPDNAAPYRDRVDLAIDHHPSYEGFGRFCHVEPERAACGEILYEIALELGVLTPEIALPLYVAVATDTGCFVYSNVTADTHRVAAALMLTGIDARSVNKTLFRTKSKKRLALEGRLLNQMQFFDGGRVVVVRVSRALMEELDVTEDDMDDLAALGGLVEGQDCSITMKETPNGDWKVSVRTGPRVDASRVCAKFGGGGHRAAAGCLISGMSGEAAARALVAACTEAGHA